MEEQAAVRENIIDFETKHDGEVLVLKDGPMATHGAVEITHMPISKIKLARNSRMDVSDDEIAGLMASIKSVGLLQPIGVVKSGTKGYEICYGNRRFLACSKLGMKRIPAIIHTNSKNASDIDLKNLTENVQRKNIGLTEAGRYFELLRNQGLTHAECAARLGISPNYVKSCVEAFREVPEEFRKHLEVQTSPSAPISPGKIGVRTALNITSAVKSHNLDKKQVTQLFTLAREKDGFNRNNIKEYAAALKAGSTDPIKDAGKIRSVNCIFRLKQKEFERLEKEFVIDGPFRSVNGLIRAILRGEKKITINVL